MSVEKARKYFEKYGMDERVKELEESIATVELAAKALNCSEAMIAKTLSFDVNGKTVLVVMAGDCKVDNAKYKQFFQTKAKMLQFDEVEPRVGHAVGGVCPFGINEGVEVYLDNSLKRFEKVYPACGNSKSFIELRIEELEDYSNNKEWIDVSK